MQRMKTLSLVLILAVAGVAAGQTSQPVSERVMKKNVLIQASRAQVWHAWTTKEGLESFFGEQASVELKPGGKYEIFFSLAAPEGQRGSEGCRVVSYIPYEMLAFTWNAPPKLQALRDAGARTLVVVQLSDHPDGRTRVDIAQLGYGDGDEWLSYYMYFDRAWAYVLSELRTRLQTDPLGPAEMPAATSNEHTDGRVRVVATTAPVKRQDFEIVLPRHIKDVWHALATSAGLTEILGAPAEVELKIDGKYMQRPGANNRVLAWVPYYMLSGTGSAPEEFPAVRQGSTWWMYTFEPKAELETRLRLTLVGWQEGEEWDRAYDYFLKANAQFLNHVYEKLTPTPPSAGGED